MIYPANFEHKIAFEHIRKLLKENCISTLGESMIEKISFSNNYKQICLLHEQTEEFRQLLLFDTPFPSQDYFDLRQEWARIKKEGTYIDLEKLIELRICLQTIEQTRSYFLSRQEKNKYPNLLNLSQRFEFDNQWIISINNIIDEKGNVKDNASEKLQKIRQQIKSLEKDISINIKKILSQAKQDKLIDDNADITVRNGRMVLPVPAVNKRKIKGFVHDSSTTGQTYFIEPQEVFEANNLLQNLQIDEHIEIIQILTTFTEQLRPNLEIIAKGFHYLALLDFIRAKSKFAIQFNACKPIIVNKPIVDWQEARHPILEANLKQQGKSIVPLNITLGNTYSILIISGPNAGGKSVCLKTLALLQYMFQVGIPVPASPNSEFGIFNDLFINIGDEQSIDNDLSTYSSQLINIKTLLEKANKNSLFMFDELGSGTDPQYGGAIAETLIEELAQKNTIGLITTHFGNLKALAQQHQNIENGAMLFDEKKMQSTFQLKIGQFGTSFTFEIAENIGLDKLFLEKAKSKVGKYHIRYDKLVRNLEHQQIALAKHEKMLEFTDNQLSELIKSYTEKDNELKNKRYEILHQAKNEAKTLLKNSNQLIERTIKEIKEKKADKQIVKQLREEIQTEIKKIEKSEPIEIQQIKKDPTNEEIHLHDIVLLQDTQTLGEVIDINDDDIVISFNSIQVKTSKDKVVKTDKTNISTTKNKPKNDIYQTIHEKSIHFNLQLDIRGYRAEEAIAAMNTYIDDALLLSIHEINILHGKGNGILRQVVREYLANNNYVKSFHDEHIERGGHGITVVKLI